MLTRSLTSEGSRSLEIVFGRLRRIFSLCFRALRPGERLEPVAGTISPPVAHQGFVLDATERQLGRDGWDPEWPQSPRQERGQ